MADLGAAVDYGQLPADDQEQRKVVVLGVPWQTEDSTLEHHFSQFGSVEEAQIMRERYTGKSRGFGFVTFSSAGDARGAVASEHLIEGRRCEAKFALPEGKVGSARTTRIFVARIPSSVSDLQFRGYFEQFGTVQDAYMPKDPSKQGHRGIGFVTYAAADSVERVMAGAHVLNGNEIAIDRATPKSTPKDRPGVMLPGRLSMSQPNLPLLAGGGPALGGAGFHGFMHGPGGGGMPVPGRGYDEGGVYGGGGGLGSRRMSHPALSTGAQLGSPPPQGGMGPRVPSGPMPLSGLAGYGSSGAGLNLLAQAQALQHHLSSNSLSSLDGNASSQQLINLINANVAAAAAAAAGGGPHGGGGGGYHHPGMPPSASSGHLHGSAHSSSADLAGLLAQQDHMAAAAAAAGGGHGGWGGPVRGAGGPPLGHPGAQGGAGPFGPASARAGPRIFVGKLNRETSEQDVKDYFSRFGYVLDVYLPRDKNNKREHRGFGFVTFETDASIQRVVSHGPHHVRGSIVAIDSAVPRQEEQLVLTLDGAPHQGHQGPPPGAMHPGPPPGTDPHHHDPLQGDHEAEALQALGALGLDGGAHGGRHAHPSPGAQNLSY